MEDNYTPRVGDWVEITLSSDCWNPNMDIFIGKCFKIKEIRTSSVVYNRRYGAVTILDNENIHESLKGVSEWNWFYEQGHYKFHHRVLKSITKKLKLKI